jgi:hypothetical protein
MLPVKVLKLIHGRHQLLLGHPPSCARRTESVIPEHPLVCRVIMDDLHCLAGFGKCKSYQGFGSPKDGSPGHWAPWTW